MLLSMCLPCQPQHRFSGSDVHLKWTRPPQVDASTSGGRAHFSWTRPLQVDASTSGGRLHCPLQVDASTSGGRAHFSGGRVHFRWTGITKELIYGQPKKFAKKLQAHNIGTMPELTTTKNQPPTADSMAAASVVLDAYHQQQLTALAKMSKKDLINAP